MSVGTGMSLLQVDNTPMTVGMTVVTIVNCGKSVRL